MPPMTQSGHLDRETVARSVPTKVFSGPPSLPRAFTTSGSGDDRGAPNSDGDGDDDNTRSSALSNENRSR